MQDLIDRLGKATGPDRKIDRDIFCVLDEFRVPCKEYAMAWISHDRAVLAPAYTSSIDAALTLVPPWHKWSVACGKRVQYVARITPSKGDWGCSDGECDSTPAIALCIAALKARLAHSTIERE